MDTDGKCRSATEGGPRTARPYLPVSLQPKRQTRELVPLPELGRRSTNSVFQRPAPRAVRFKQRTPSRMTTTAVFPFDVAARGCIRSYHLSDAGTGLTASNRLALVIPKRNWGRPAVAARGYAAHSPTAVPHSRDSATNPGRRRGARSSWGRRRCIWFERRRRPGRAWHRCFSRDTSRYRGIDDLVLGIHAEAPRGSEVGRKSCRPCHLRDRSAHQARSVRLTFGPKPFDAACKKTERRSCAVEPLQPCSVISAIFGRRRQ